MSYQFHAHWEQSASGEKTEVCVVLSTGRRDFSPDMHFSGNEVVVCGIRASHLAMAGEGEIATPGNRALIIPGAMNYELVK